MINADDFVNMIKPKNTNAQLQLKYGIINSINGNKYSILIDGSQNPTKKYHSSIVESLNIGDRIAFLKQGNDILIIGGIK